MLQYILGYTDIYKTVRDSEREGERERDIYIYNIDIYIYVVDERIIKLMVAGSGG